MSELIPIRAFYHKHEAQMAQGLLKDKVIESMISADDCGGYRPHLSLGTGNNRLLVKQEDVEQAKIILQTLDQPLSDAELDTPKEQPPSPQEQSFENPRRNTFVIIGTLLIFIPPIIIILVILFFFNS
jgi:hypothetical protein